MKRITEWIKTHKLVTALAIVVVYLLLKGSLVRPLSLSRQAPAPSRSSFGGAAGLSPGRPIVNLRPGVGLEAPELSFQQDVATTVPADERLVITNSNISLLVEDVRQVGKGIVDYAVSQGGFMVSTSYNRPTESPFATITVRVPSAKFDEGMDFFRSLAIKVTNENLIGTDVTEEFVDIEARIATLEKTKAKFEEILEKAEKVDEILRVQREIINMQTQIDTLKGRRDALEKNAELSKITVYLSTDELALPYTPDKTFRPGVVFKLAVRALLNTLRIIGSAAIWAGVYSVVWAPALITVFVYRRWRRKKQPLP
ncbi:DUF4349 domain-containing protein [Patescibacteria group bacterium]|nr:DUF4349 domain-containing protein [Patescibacteria group bacterium]